MPRHCVKRVAYNSNMIPALFAQNNAIDVTFDCLYEEGEKLGSLSFKLLFVCSIEIILEGNDNRKMIDTQ